MAAMADRLDDTPSDVAGMLEARLGLHVDPCAVLLDLLRAARIQSQRLAGHNAGWVLDVQNALNDLIEGIEGEVLQL